MIFSIEGVRFKDIIDYHFLQIEESKMTFIVGKSGSGKSTLLKLLNATVSADSGKILYNGKDITDYDTIALRREVLLCGQNVYLLEGTIKNNFESFYAYRDTATPDDESMRKYLKLCLADFPPETDCANLSGGEKQRIYLAIFLSFLPKVLLLDEPTSALDETNSIELFKNLKFFCNEKAITAAVVSHNRKLAELFADNIIDLSGAQKYE